MNRLIVATMMTILLALPLRNAQAQSYASPSFSAPSYSAPIHGGSGGGQRCASGYSAVWEDGRSVCVKCPSGYAYTVDKEKGTCIKCPRGYAYNNDGSCVGTGSPAAGGAAGGGIGAGTAAGQGTGAGTGTAAGTAAGKGGGASSGKSSGTVPGKGASTAAPKGAKIGTGGSHAVVERDTQASRGCAGFTGIWKIVANGHPGSVLFEANWLDIDGHDEEITNCSFDSGTKSIRFTRPHVSQEYSGTFDGTKMAGTFTQGGRGAYRWEAVPMRPTAVREEPKPAAGIVGTWRIFTGGNIGTPNEKTIYYRGSLVFAGSAGSYTGTLSFGSNETLKRVSLSGNIVRFARPLSGVTQYYEGTLVNQNKIEGTFDHQGTKQYWRAERGD